MHKEEERKISVRRDSFTSIAVWQVVTFSLLLLFVWASELLDAPAHLFGSAPTPFSIYRVSVLTLGILAAAIVAVGHTYEQQRGLLRRLLKTCLYCHRVETPQGVWEHVEEYFIRHYPVPMDRVACPACEQMLESVADKKPAPAAK
jgi:hypothetical protein